MAKVTIDGFETEVPDGTTILNAARQIGGDIVPPAMCYYSTLKGSGGKCRTCLVKVTKGSEKDPRPMPKLVASCQTTVMEEAWAQGFDVQVHGWVYGLRDGHVHPLNPPVRSADDLNALRQRLADGTAGADV